MKQNTIPVQIKAQYVKDLSFEAPDLPQILTQLTEAPTIDVNVGVNGAKTKEEKEFTVELKLTATATQKATKKTVFLCEVVYGALVHIDVEEKMQSPIMLVEIPTLLFPFARAIIANLTREAGFPALQIAPINFGLLYQQKLEQEAQKEAPHKDDKKA